MYQRLFVWPLFWLVMGFALGGSYVWGWNYTPKQPLALHSNNQHYSHRSEPAEHSESQPKGTASEPLFVQVITSPKSADERAQETEDREEKKDADRWLVRWTFALFAATIGLIMATGVLGYFAYRQASDMKESIAAAKDSADASVKAANIAERTLTELERPYVFVQTPKFAPNAFPGRPDRIQYILKNYGRTPAIVRWFTAAVRTTGQPPKLLWNEIFNGQVILASGEEREFKVVGVAGAMAYPKGDLSVPDSIPVLNIEVTYSDVFDFYHVSAFTFFESQGEFHAIGGEAYNRRKSAKLPPGVEWTPSWSSQS